MGGVFAGLLEEQSRYSAERLVRRGRLVVAAPSPARGGRDRMAAEVARVLATVDDHDPPASVLLRLRGR